MSEQLSVTNGHTQALPGQVEGDTTRWGDGEHEETPADLHWHLGHLRQSLQLHWHRKYPSGHAWISHLRILGDFSFRIQLRLWKTCPTSPRQKWRNIFSPWWRRDSGQTGRTPTLGWTRYGRRCQLPIPPQAANGIKVCWSVLFGTWHISRSTPKWRMWWMLQFSSPTPSGTTGGPSVLGTVTTLASMTTLTGRITSTTTSWMPEVSFEELFVYAVVSL